MRRFFLAVFFLAAVTSVATAGDSPVATSGEMPSSKERHAAWADQAKDAVAAEDRPWISGSMTWRGRADRNYKPFQQWELRLSSPVSVAGLELRIRALNDRLVLMPNGDSQWRQVGDLTAGAQREVAVKLNVSNPALYEIDLRWRGSQGITYQGFGELLPTLKGSVSGPRLFATYSNIDHSPRTGVASIEFMLRNLGSASASGITVRTIFLNDKGKEVASATHSLRAIKSLAPGDARELKVRVDRVPSYHTLRMIARCEQDDQLATGVISEASEIQVGRLALSGTRLTGAVRNGLTSAVKDLVVTLTLFDQRGAVQRTIKLPAMALASRQVQDFSIDVGKLGAWATFSTELDYAKAE